MFEKITITGNRNETLCYYRLVPKDSGVESAIVYLHGLISDYSWFKVPDCLPERTAVVYIQRQPKNDTSNFMEWYEHYQGCLSDFRENFNTSHLHLVANCFGCLPALLWMAMEPETFTTLTLCNPIVGQKKNFRKTELLKIFYNNVAHRKNFRKIFLKARDFSRIPDVNRFIDNATDTTYDFSDSFFFQVWALRNWLGKNLIDIGIPVHTIFSYEDDVVDMAALNAGFWKRVKPTKSTYFHTDHFLELQPQSSDFWNEIIEFQLKYETNFQNVCNESVKRVLVTGATGFLGRHILDYISRRGLKVVVLAREMKKAIALFNGMKNIEIVEGDLGNLDSLEKALDNIDVVVHSAGLVSDWENAELFRKVNVEGTKNLLIIAHAKGIKQFVLVGSLGVFGDTNQNYIGENEQLRLTTDSYSNSKIEQEFFVKKYCLHSRIPFTIIRPGFIYGEGDTRFMPKMISSIKKRKMKFIGSGSNHVNTVYVGNVAYLVSKVIGYTSCYNQSYNLSDKKQVEIKKFVDDITGTLKLPKVKRKVPLRVALAITWILENIYRLFKISTPPPFTRKKITFLARDRKTNSEKAYKVIGNGFISYDEGIARTLDYFKQ